ncbi:MAG: hypothetical protein KKD21_04475 [Proteobacteria bacterium]|nr:hypothetical protein [Pseudomonadota bacterium]MBU1696287.1 hypothetical protein [Pseudomonadota bacterium]
MPDIKVVLMSGYAEEIIRKKDLILPGYNFIESPSFPAFLPINCAGYLMPNEYV